MCLPLQGVAPEFAETLSAAGAGPQTLAARIHASPAFSNFFLVRWDWLGLWAFQDVAGIVGLQMALFETF